VGFANGSGRGVWDFPGLVPYLEVSTYCGFFTPGWGTGTAEELDVVSIETGEMEDSPPHTPAYE